MKEANIHSRNEIYQTDGTLKDIPFAPIVVGFN